LVNTPCEICGCPKDKWLPVTLVARRFRCTPKKVRRLIKSGELDGVRFGGVWRVDHQSLDDYILRDSIRFMPPEH